MISASVDCAVLQQLQAFFNLDHVGLGDHINVVCVYVYGSVARGEARGTSDIDVAVLYAQEPSPTLDGLELELGYTLERLREAGRPGHPQSGTARPHPSRLAGWDAGL